MAESTQYVIRGGVEGRERLRVLSRAMQPTTAAFLDRVGLRDGLACLDVGCGGGDVTLEIARRVAPHGSIVGADIDEAKLEIARQEAKQLGVTNAEFRAYDVTQGSAAGEFDVVHGRCLLTHLPDPASAVRAFYRHVRPGGVVALEDIDFSGYFTYPECPAFERYKELYCAVVRGRGADPNIGPRLPLLLRDAGFVEIAVTAVQPIGIEGEVKVLNALTMQNIADPVLADGLATREEIDQLVRELHAFAEDRNTVAGVPRMVQAWGRRPAA